MEKYKIKKLEKSDIKQVIDIWNDVVIDGVAFPQTELLNEDTGLEFFNSQSFTGVAYNSNNNEIVGLYILHPNNVGRCGHISNASYAVKKDKRGQHIGELLVKNCIIKANYNLEYKFATLIFESINPENAKNVRWTDNDNLAIKMTTDVIQRHYLISDNSRITSSFCCRISCKSDEPHTNIYVLPIKFTAVDLLKNYYERTDKNENNQIIDRI